MKIHKALRVFLGFSSALILSGCCDCLDPAEDPTELPCSVREMTITRFDAGLIIRGGQNDDDPQYVPVPSYNIHSFRFGHGNSTGTLENDPRFSDEAGIDKISVEEYDLPGFPYKLVIFDDAPANEDLNGDILVEEVNIINPGVDNALIRVKGYLGFFRQDFWSESSTQFCEYIEANNDLIIERFIAKDGNQGYSEFGKDIGLGKVEATTRAREFGIVDKSGNIISEDISTLDFDISGFTPEQIRNLAGQIERDEEEIYSIRVEVGDVFYYIAENGRHYLFAVINIGERNSQGQQEPAIKQRVSIIFSEL